MQLANLISRGKFAFSAFALLAVSQAALSKQSASDTVNIRTEAIPEIEVIGERPLTEVEVSRGVRDIAQSYRIKTPLERFHDPLCLTVAGLGEELGNQVAELIRENAREATLTIAEEGCTTNALMIVVDNPERLIERMREAQPQMFPFSSRREISAAIYRGDPVIAWSAAAIRGANGLPLADSPGVAGGGIVFDNGNASVPTTDAFIPSRTRIPYSLGRDNSVAIFDVRRLEDVHINQLADYATLFLIGTPRRLPDYEELGGMSILSLFKNGPRQSPIGLTPLDRAYLRGLYSLRPNEGAERLGNSTRVAYSEITGRDCAASTGNCESD